MVVFPAVVTLEQNRSLVAMSTVEKTNWNIYSFPHLRLLTKVLEVLRSLAHAVADILQGPTRCGRYAIDQRLGRDNILAVECGTPRLRSDHLASTVLA